MMKLTMSDIDQLCQDKKISEITPITPGFVFAIIKGQPNIIEVIE